MQVDQPKQLKDDTTNIILEVHLLGAFLQMLSQQLEKDPDVKLGAFFQDALKCLYNRDPLGTRGQAYLLAFGALSLIRESHLNSISDEIIDESGKASFGIESWHSPKSPRYLVRRMRNALAHGSIAFDNNGIVHFSDRDPRKRDDKYHITFKLSSLVNTFYPFITKQALQPASA